MAIREKDSRERLKLHLKKLVASAPYQVPAVVPLTLLQDTMAAPMRFKRNGGDTQPFLQWKDESFMNAQRQEGIRLWLLCVQEELQRQNGSGLGRMLRGGIDSYPGFHHGRNK